MSGDSYKEKGNEEFKKGNYEKAIEQYTFACECDPKNHIYYTNRANCYAQMKRWDKSLRDAEKAVSLKSDWEKGWYRKGLALTNLGKHQEAMEAFDQCVRLAPSNDDFKKAADTAKKELYKGLSDAEILKLDGNALTKAGDFPGAIKKYTAALEKTKDDDSTKKLRCDLYNNRAHCWVQLYEPTKIRADCDEVIKLDDDNMKARLRRAAALESLEKWKAALEDYEYVARKEPNSKAAVEGVARIKDALKSLSESESKSSKKKA